MSRQWRYAAVGRGGSLAIDALMATTRVERINDGPFRSLQAQGQPVIFALWHGRLLPPTWAHRHEGVMALASRSEDGEYITRVLHHWGYGVVRGSSSRGGESALRELVQRVREGHSVALTADGPRGPREKLKFGVLQIAQRTGAPIIPLGTAVSRAWRFNSWDRFMLPKPFARVRIAYGDPVYVPKTTDAGSQAAEAAAMERRIAEQTERAEAAVASGGRSGATG
jgi:lysophospholipid acyltransferase (LPLAT)-like uncharacterized protein